MGVFREVLVEIDHPCRSKGDCLWFSVQTRLIQRIETSSNGIKSGDKRCVPAACFTEMRVGRLGEDLQSTEAASLRVLLLLLDTRAYQKGW